MMFVIFYASIKRHKSLIRNKVDGSVAVPLKPTYVNELFSVWLANSRRKHSLKAMHEWAGLNEIEFVTSQKQIIEIVFYSLDDLKDFKIFFRPWAL